MEKRYDWIDAVLPLTALLPALGIAWAWPNSVLGDLPYLTLPLYAAYHLGLALGLPRPPAFGFAGLISAAIWAVSASLATDQIQSALLAAGCLLGLAILAAHRLLPGRLERAAVVVVRGLALGTLFALLTVSGLTLSSASRRLASDGAPPTAQRPGFFLPLEIDPTGQRLLLFSLRDLDHDDPESFSIWSLDLADGTPSRMYQGFPLFLTDWAPRGERAVFLHSQSSWEEDSVPFGLTVANLAGESRELLAPPADGGTWMYPLWSKQGDRISAWKVSESGLGAVQDIPRSFVAPAAGGPAKELTVSGCRLALLAAWEAAGTGCFAVTERGLFLVPEQGKPRRLVPTGEAPLDPFPFVVPQGVAPSGKHLAYLELVFKRGEIERMELHLTDLRGKRQVFVRDLYPVGFGWSRDGRVLAAVEVGRNNEVLLHALEVEQGKHQRFKTGLQLANRDLPMRATVSRDGRYVALDGQIADEQSWDIAVVDLQTGKTTSLSRATNHLAIGWRADNKLIVADLSNVASINPDGTGFTPIYGSAAEPGGFSEIASLGTALANQTLRGVEQLRRARAAF